MATRSKTFRLEPFHYCGYWTDYRGRDYICHEKLKQFIDVPYYHNRMKITVSTIPKDGDCPLLLESINNSYCIIFHIKHPDDKGWTLITKSFYNWIMKLGIKDHQEFYARAEVWRE